MRKRSWERASGTKHKHTKKAQLGRGQTLQNTNRLKINYIHANPVRSKLVNTARDYYWSSFRSFYGEGDDPLAVDNDWWWPDDAEKLSKALKELGWYSYWVRVKK